MVFPVLFKLLLFIITPVASSDTASESNTDQAPDSSKPDESQVSKDEAPQAASQGSMPEAQDNAQQANICTCCKCKLSRMVCV